ncbi:MAG: cupin domain-containing protein [Actinobacteria bacterium]|nr:cupin domain-containing protein [Actinomycetota bacterium]
MAAAIAVVAFSIGSPLATPSSGVTAEAVRGPITKNLNIDTTYSNHSRLKLKTSGHAEFIVQRIEATPGATFGWHNHPAESIAIVKQGVLTLYHDEHCNVGTDYGPGGVFTTSPSEIHLAKNLSSTETLVLFAVYIGPKTSPDTPIRVDQPLPAPGCPQ